MTINHHELVVLHVFSALPGTTGSSVKPLPQSDLQTNVDLNWLTETNIYKIFDVKVRLSATFYTVFGVCCPLYFSIPDTV